MTAPERPAGRMARPARPAGARGHGSRERYRQHILERTEPCDACREAERVGKASYRARLYLNRGPMLVDSTGTRRRVRALAAIGWPAGELAALVGCERTNVSKWTKQRLVHVTTRDTVRALYDALSMTPGPSAVARARAGRAGWPSPLAWDDESIDDPAARPHRAPRPVAGRPVDEVAVARAMHGDQVHLRPPERAEAVRRLTSRGFTAAQIADRLHTTPRSVVRHRTRNEPVRRSA